MADVLTETRSGEIDNEASGKITDEKRKLVLAPKLNCWEVKKCGREPGGAKVAELGVCPAASERMFDGIFGGRNSGRACWVVAGTFCKGEVQGTFAQKFKNCANCDFFKRVREEEGSSFHPVHVLMSYIDRTHEQRVDERTHELREAKENLEKLNRKLEAANVELAHVNRIASLDMAMAARIQASFFPRSAPKSGVWEVSFVFRPLSGVSGDFYDFYTKDGELRGVSLFDVSGHGIAPGLLTLLARSIIRHHFSAGENRRLGAVVESANRSLVKELDAIENYLTGIVLRFSGNRVEYVNAGHTDLLLRVAATNVAVKVEPKNREFRGNFLGISALQSKFPTVTFSLEQGDSLFLFSDCLSETKSALGEEYGVDRIRRSLETASRDADANAIAGHVLGEFQAFVDPKMIKDDLTFILIRRVAEANYQGDYAI